VGIPKTGRPTELMAHVAARNIVAQIKGQAPQTHKALGDIPAVCVMDAGNNGVLILADKMLSPPPEWVAHPRPPVARHEARVREVLPVEGPPWLRQAPLTDDWMRAT
jgi:hypothetical protein